MNIVNTFLGQKSNWNQFLYILSKISVIDYSIKIKNVYYGIG